MIFSISSSQPQFINPEPITIKGIKRECPTLYHIFTNKRGQVDEFVPVAYNPKGAALKTIYKKLTQKDPDKQWMGKLGNVRWILRSDPSTIRTRSRREANVDAILEKLAYDLFQELGRGLFLVPKSRLSYQPVKDVINQLDLRADEWVQNGTNDTLRIMSRYVKGYSDLRDAFTKLDGMEDSISFMDYLINCHRPPEMILTPAGALVPLQGLMSLLSVGRCLADVDLLGGGGLNAGFVWVYDDQESIIAAKVVKIDPGYAFHFTTHDPQNPCENWVVNTAKKLGSVRYHLEDYKDIQISTGNFDAIVQWSALTKGQQEEFLGALLNSSRYLSKVLLSQPALSSPSPTSGASSSASSSSSSSSSSASSSSSSSMGASEPSRHTRQVLDFLFYRDGKFTHSGDAFLPRELSDDIQREMTDWIEWQLKIYEEPLKAFQAEYPEQLLKIRYIDEFGELPLPMSQETLPIREIFTELVLIEEGPSTPIEEKPYGFSEASSSSSSSAPMPRVTSRHTSQFGGLELGPSKTVVQLAHLFEENTKKVLLLGEAGTGKSTLFQKIAHDWASGRLFSQKFKAVYWIPLSLLHHRAGTPIEISIADTVARHFLKVPELVPSVLAQLSKRNEILLVFDGFDEASPAIKEGLRPLFDDPNLHILLSSRFGQTDFLPTQIERRVETVGFHEEQLRGYAHQFFARRSSEKSQEMAQRFLESLKKESHFSQLAKTPLYLQMLCALWEKNRSATTLTGLYDTLIHEMMAWQLRRLNGSEEEITPILSALGSLAASRLMEGAQFTTERELVTLLQPHRLSPSNLVEMGIIKAATPDYRFSHLTFQEYLTAYHLSQLATPDQKQFLSDNPSNPSYHTVIVFFFGIIAKQRPDEINSFFEALGVTRRRIDLVFRCLNECEGCIDTIPAIEQLFLEDPLIISESIDIGGKAQQLTRHLVDQNLSHALDWLLRAKPELLNPPSGNNDSLLTRAALNGNVDLMERLVSCAGSISLIHQFSVDGMTPLHAAAYGGHIPAMEWLCNRDPLLIGRFRTDGVTPLHAAAQEGHIPAMEWLCNRDPSLIGRFMTDGRTPLHEAAQRGYIPAMEWLCTRDPLLIGRFKTDGLTPLHVAAYNGHIPAMEWLCNRHPLLIGRFRTDGWTPLHVAAQGGHIPTMEWLCTRDPSLIGCFMTDGWTPLHSAAEEGHIPAMEWLCNRDPSLIGRFMTDGWTPLHSAAEEGHIPAMEWLCNRDPSLIGRFMTDGWTPLHEAARQGHIPAMEWLCNRDPSLIGRFETDGWTPLHEAARQGHIPAMEWLCNRDPSLIGCFMTDGWTPLHSAAEEGHIPAMEWLCNRDPSLIGCFMTAGWTPLHSAAGRGDIPAMEWLCTRDPSLIGRFTTDGATPLHSAAQEGHIPAMEWLCTRDHSLIGRFRTDGCSPLHAAAQKGHIPAMEWLCARDPSLIGRFRADGCTPLHAAAQKGHIPAMEWLCNLDPSLIGRFRTDGWTPLHSSAYGGHIPAMEWLCTRDPSLIDRFMTDVGTPLHSAAQEGHIPAMDWLVSRFPRLLQIRCRGLTPYDLVRRRNDSTTEWLTEQMRARGVDPNASE